MNAHPPPPQSSWAWFLDVDGTLAAIAPTPEMVVVDESIRAMITTLLNDSHGAVALLSGRSIHNVDQLFRIPMLPVAGQHGAERRDASGECSANETRPDALDVALVEASQLAQQHPALRIEDKGMTVAIHYRQQPDLESIVVNFARAVEATSENALCIILGKCVVEFVAAGHDKGTALRAFMSESPFAGRVPVFVGDDVTDEHAFAAVNELNGVSIKVGPESSCAVYRLDDVDAVKQWLSTIPALSRVTQERARRKHA